MGPEIDKLFEIPEERETGAQWRLMVVAQDI